LLVKTITIRDLRQRWPEAEAALQIEDEILITRDSKPVAKLVRISGEAARRSRWDPSEHARWQRKVSGGVVSRSDTALAAARADLHLARSFDGAPAASSVRSVLFVETTPLRIRPSSVGATRLAICPPATLDREPTDAAPLELEGLHGAWPL
jgi:antitoxin (DNA-binding transcriptional repressor) of toxin-antitoxin stability system